MKQIVKTLYNGIPLKKEFFSIIKWFVNVPENIFKHLHFKGVFDVRLPGNKKFTIMHHGVRFENELFWAGFEGCQERDSLTLWSKLCLHNSVILDIGANTGIFSLIARTLNPEAAIYAFEPHPGNFQKLITNNALNNSNIICLEYAASDFDGIAKIYPVNTDFVYSVTVNKNMSASDINVTELEIKTVTLKTFIEKNNIAEIGLMKIDVETHEAEVLKGLGNYLGKFKPDMLIEILNDNVAENVEQLIAGLDYLYFNINENGSIRQTSKLSKSDFFNFLICKKETAEYLKLI